MKKKLVSKDPLAEKIEEILTPYPISASYAISEHEPRFISCKAGLFPAKTTERKHAAIKSPRKMLPSISTAESPTRCATPRPAGGITTIPNTRNLPHRWSAS